MYEPWKELEQYRGDRIKGEWPTIPEMFAITASKFPERRAFSAFSPKEILFTYKEASEVINRVSLYLLDQGIKKGDHVAVTGKNSPEWALAFLAILNMGAVVVPVDHGLNPKEIVDLLEISDTKYIFTDKDKYSEIKTGGGAAVECISLTENFENYILFLNANDKLIIEKPVETDLAAILYTSGTTGVSKGVMLTHRNFTSDAFLAQGNLKIDYNDVFYALLPIHHSYTMTSVFLESIFVGAEVIFGKQLVFSQIQKDFREGKVTMFLGVPMLFNKLIGGILSGVRKKGIILYGIIKLLMSISGFIKKTLKVNPGKKMFNFLLKQASLEHIRICISGGGPLAPSTFKQFNQLGIDFVQGYGLTEAAPMLALNPKEHYKETSVGKVLPHTEMKIENPDADGIGDILAKGPNIMAGYYKDDESTRNAFTEDGFLKTGDAGYLDSENYLYLTGRKSSLIVTEGGKNVYPEELEEAFQFYYEYDQILVKGYVKNKETLSEGIEIAFHPAEDFSKNRSEEEIKAFFEGIVKEVNRGLQSYKHIERVHVLREPMSTTTTKKIRRNEVNKTFDQLSKY